MWKKVLRMGGRAGKAVVPYMTYIKVGVAALFISVIGTHLYNDHRRTVEVKDLAVELGTLKEKYGQTTHTLEVNEKALAQCIDANAWNALQAKDQELKNALALAELKRLKENRARSTEDIYRDEENLRNHDQTCRTADEPLPDWLLPDSLWHD